MMIIGADGEGIMSGYCWINTGEQIHIDKYSGIVPARQV